MHGDLDTWDHGLPPAREAAKLSRRERLELVKPLIAANDSQPQSLRDDPRSRARWSWVWHVAGQRQYGGSDLIGQARSEISSEREHGSGHIWQSAWGSPDPIERWPFRYEATVNFPLGIRRGKNELTRYQRRRFITAWGAQRWLARRSRFYDRYVRRLIKLGRYDV